MNDSLADIKRTQREYVFQNLGKVMLATLLIYLPNVVLSIVSTLLSLSDPQTVQLGGNLMVQLLSILVMAPLTLGMSFFCIRLMREGTAKASEVYSPFASMDLFKKSLAMFITLGVRTLLWVLPTAIVSALVLALFHRIALVLIPLCAIAFLLVGVRLNYYTGAYLLVKDHPEMGSWEAQRQSAQFWAGRLGELLRFYLSFIGWLVLEFAISFCAVMPFFSLAFRAMRETLPHAVALPAFLASSAWDWMIWLLPLFIVLHFAVTCFISAYISTSYFAYFEQIAPAPEKEI